MNQKWPKNAMNTPNLEIKSMTVSLLKRPQIIVLNSLRTCIPILPGSHHFHFHAPSHQFLDPSYSLTST